VDFELLDAAHDQTHTIFATTAGYLDYITGADVPNPGARDKLSPLMRMACQHLYKRGDGLQAANDLCVASRDPWTAVGASRLIFRHESEWANPEKWTPLIAELEKISRNREALAAEHERIQALTWWADVKAHYPALPDPKVFHIHPIGMVGNHIGGDFMACTHCGANLAITPEILIRLFPRINIHNSEGYAKELTRIISEFRIDNCHRLAHFLGQCEVECSGFTAFKEDLYYKDGDYLWSTYRTALKGGLGRLHPTWSLDEMERHAKLKLVRNDAELGRVLFGDGEYPDVDFRGRGLLHLTWKENYAAYTAARGVDVLADPSVVRNDRYVSADTGAWYWSNKGTMRLRTKIT
jgi:predicted chitinase